MSGAAIGRDALRRVRIGSAALVASAIRWGAFSAVALAATVATAAPVWSSGFYTPSAWTLGSNNLLSGATADASSLTRFDQGSSSHSISTLTDGEVPGSTYDISKVFGIKSGSAVWTFLKADIEQIRVFTRWADGGRDGVNISSVAVRYDGSEEWTDIGAPSISYNSSSSGSGSLYAILKDSAGAALAVGVTGLRLYFGTQENNGAGYAEIEAIAYDESIRWDAGAWTTWTVGSHNVLNGLSPSESSEVHVGNVESGQLGSAEKLTNGAVPSTRPGNFGEFCDIHSGAVLVYQLASAVDISEFRFCTFWDSGRNRIDIAGIDYSTDGGNNWTTIPNSAIGYFESSSSSTKDRASFAASDGSAIAPGANAVRFRFGDQESKWVSYGEIEALPTIYYKSGVFAEGSLDLKVVTRSGEGNETEIALSSGDNVVFDDTVAGANAIVCFGETLPTGVTYSFSDNWTGTVLPDGVDTATTYIWTGANGDGNMNTDGNWYGNAAPSTGAAVYIPAAKTVTIVNNIENFAPASITFGSGSGQVTIGGNAITGVAAITNHSSAVQTFNAEVSGNAIDIYNTSSYVTFPGGIEVATLAASDGLAFYGNWCVKGDWNTNKKTMTVKSGSSFEVEGTLINAYGLTVENGATLTAQNVRADDVNMYFLKNNSGTFIVKNEMILAMTSSNGTKYKLPGLFCNGGQNAVTHVKGIVNSASTYQNAQITLNNKDDSVSNRIVLGAGGLSYRNCHRINTNCYPYFQVDRNKSVILESSDDWNIAANTFKSGGVSLEIQDGATATVNTSDYDNSSVARRVRAIGIIGNSGTLVVKGCGTMTIEGNAAGNTLKVQETATLSVLQDKAVKNVEVASGATLQVAQSGTVAPSGTLTLADGAALGFNFTDSATAPVLNVTDKTVTLGDNGAVSVKVSAADGVRPKGGSYVLTSGGNFTGATVSLASDAPNWAGIVSVNADGNIVLDVKPTGLMLFVR